MKKILNWIWPSIVDAQSAKKASKYGIYVSLLIALPLLFTVIWLIKDINGAKSVIRVLVYVFFILLDAIIGYGVYKSKIFAPLFGIFIILLIKYFEWRINILEDIEYKMIWISIYMLMYVNSARGIYFYRKYNSINVDVGPISVKD